MSKSPVASDLEIFLLEQTRSILVALVDSLTSQVLTLSSQVDVLDSRVNAIETVDSTYLSVRDVQFSFPMGQIMAIRHARIVLPAGA